MWRPLLFLTGLVIACSPPHSTEAPATAKSYQRILSLSPPLTETLFALGAGPRVVGRTDYCRWPAEALRVESVGGFLNVDWEKIYTLAPDLAIHMHSDNEAYQTLDARGIDRLTIRCDTMAEALSAMQQIANRVGLSERGHELVASIQASLEQTAQRRQGIEALKTLIIVGREPGTFQSLYAAGPGSFVSELVARAGGQNVLGPTLGHFPEISRETILASNPEVILDTILETTEHPTSAEIERERTVYQETFPTVNAVAHGRVILWTDPHLTIPGPSMAEQVEALARVIRPEMFD